MFSRSVLAIISVLCVYLHADPIIQCSPASKNWPSSKNSLDCGVLVSAISDLPKRGNPYKMVLMLDLSDNTDPAVQSDIVSASKVVVERLMNDDLLSIVVLEEGASTLSKMKYVSNSSREGFKRSLESVNKGGNPDFSKGFDLAFDELRSIKGKRFAGSGILVVTSSSPQNPEGLAERVKEEAAEKKISVSSIGVDDRFDEEFLIECAAGTGGIADYVNEDDFNVLQEEIAGIADKILNPGLIDAKLRIVTPSNIEITERNSGREDGEWIHLGNIPKGEEKFLRFSIMGRPDKSFEIETELRYSDPSDMSEWNENCYFDVSPGDSRNYYNGDLAPEIIEYWLQEKILEEVIVNKTPRRKFAKTLDDMIDDLDMRNKVLHSDYLSACLPLFQKERDELGNTAIDKSDLYKRLRYRFFKMSDYRKALDR